MKRFLAIGCSLIFVNLTMAQTPQLDWQRWKEDKAEERKFEYTLCMIFSYGFGATFAALDASQDAITFGGGKTKWGFDNGSYHAIKTWRNNSIIASGLGVGGRVVLDFSSEKGTWRTLQRLGTRLVGMGAVNWVVWDAVYLSNKGTLNLEPRYYQHWSGIDFLDKSMSPKTRRDVILVWAFKLTLVAVAISFDEL